MKNAICLITGATEGVGKHTAVELAKKGFTIVVVARNPDKAEALMKEIQASTSNTDCDYIVADLRSFSQVRQLAETFRRRYFSLDVLINNAGVFLPQRTVTEDGYETMLQVNYLSPFLLTSLLLDSLQKSQQGRIINLSSSVHRIARFDPTKLQRVGVKVGVGVREKRFSVLGTYAATKLFALMSTEELARRLKGTPVTANAVHPGIVRTRMMLHAPGVLRLVSYLSLPLSISPFEGARTSVFLASSPEVKDTSGEYFTSSKRTPVNNRFDTAENRALLWDLSLKAAEQDTDSVVRKAS